MSDEMPGDVAWREYWEAYGEPYVGGIVKNTLHHAFAAGWWARMDYEEKLRQEA